MSISENIQSRAIGLLTKYEIFCQEHELSALMDPVNPNSVVLPTDSELVAGEHAMPARQYRPGSDDDRLVDMQLLVRWLDEHCTASKGMSVTTANCYRRWLASYFDHLGHPFAATVRNWVVPFSRKSALKADADDAQYLADKAKDLDLPTKLLEAEEDTGNTRYLTTLPSRWFQRLVDQLLDHTPKGTPRYVAGPESALMLSVSLMTGLRPLEWCEAYFRESYYDPETMLTLGPVLEVRTLKQKNRRDDNPLRGKRFLVLDRWPEQQVAQLKAFCDLITPIQGDFEPFYNKVRMTISRAWKRVQKDAAKADQADNDSPAANATLSAEDRMRLQADRIIANDSRTVSAYTARHVFAEELRRSSSCTRYEIAALLGHSLLTNQVYYGPRLDEHDRDYDFVLPRPWPGDADNIQLWDQQVNPLRINYAQGDLFGGMARDSASGSTESDTGLAETFFIR